MARDPRRLVGQADWITGRDLLAAVSRSTVSNWVAAGTLVRLEPGVFALPEAALNYRVRVAAALHGREAVASHVTAHALWELIDHPPGPVHVTVHAARSGRGSDGVVVHRSPDAYAERRRVEGLPVSSVERAIVDSWGRPAPLARAEIRAATITAVRRRLCSPRELRYELTRSSRLAGRAELSRLTGLLADGCQSELEIWGCLHVLRAPGMPRFMQQRRVAVGSETFVLDAACEESMLAVEMDGAAWHGSHAQREADIRRDSLLATVGWQTLRYSHSRLTRTPEACRRDIRAVHDARLRLFRGDTVRP
jgi:very-short-patch-repair endonuclease